MVTLLTTIHEEDDNAYSIEELQALLTFLADHYDALWFGLTEGTAPTVRAVIHLYPNPKIHTLDLPAYSRDFSRKSVVQAAREAIQKASLVQLIDLDELFTWWRNDVASLTEVSQATVQKPTYVIFSRSQDALATYPPLLVQVQQVANALAGRYFNLRHVDLFGGSVLFSAELMQRLLAGGAQSQIAEWPLLAKAGGATVQTITVDGLIESSRAHAQNTRPETLTAQLEAAAAAARTLYPAAS